LKSSGVHHERHVTKIALDQNATQPFGTIIQYIQEPTKVRLVIIICAERTHSSVRQIVEKRQITDPGTRTNEEHWQMLVSCDRGHQNT